MKPSEVLDHQGDLADRAANPVYHDFVRGCLTAGGVNDGNVSIPVATKGLSMDSAETIATSLPYAVRAAEAYHVSPDMSVMTQHVAASLDETDRFGLETAPTPNGIARFDDPLPITDIRGKTMLIHWMVWTRQVEHRTKKPVLLVYMFNDWDFPDEIALDIIRRFGMDEDLLRRIQGRWGFIGCEALWDEQRMGPALVHPDPEVRAKVEEAGDIPTDFTNCARYVAAFFMLLNQTITRMSRTEGDRKTAKRARRMRLPGRVTVVELRRVEYHGDAEGEGGNIEWSHRWGVRAHPRWQAAGPNHPLVVKYGPHSPYTQQVGPDSFRVRIVVPFHIKGPEGTPLILTKKVYGLHR